MEENNIEVISQKINIIFSSGVYTVQTQTNPQVNFIQIGVAGADGAPGAAGARLYSEIPTGLINGSNTVFTVTNIILEIIDITLNGLGGEAFTLTDDKEFTLIEAPLTNDILKVIYTY